MRPSSSFLLFFKISLIYLSVMTLSRLSFLLLNPGFFMEVGWSEFFNGLRFDMIAGFYGLLPVNLLLLYPFKERRRPMMAFIMYYVIFVLSIFTLLNSIDVVYFRFTLKRSTWDIFRYVTTGDELLGLIPQFIRDYWYMYLVWAFLIAVASFLAKFIRSTQHFRSSKVNETIYTMFMIGLLLMAARGGIQLKPLNIMDASRYSTAQNSALMLNTPFTLMKTIGKEHLEAKHFFESEAEAGKYFNPLFSRSADSVAEKKNVVVIIMESLSKEYIGYYNQGQGYTPFLDSLMANSMVFTNAFANGKRSIEALPAIFSGLPNLMNEAYNTSPYAANNLASLASILKKNGYYSAFYHGGKNGTMGFNSYTQKVGFDAYFGMDEYPGKEDFDGSWGIYDLPYFQYFAKEQSQMKEPFLASIFSLSAHHPYRLPDNYTSICSEGSLKIHPMICYSDDVLRKYFKSIQQEDWYKRSIFIITADHTAQSTIDAYATSLGIFAIPLIIFEPDSDLSFNSDRTTQQADICPSILDRLGLAADGIFFGNSVFDTTSKGFAINYLSGIYQYVDDEFCIQFDGRNVVSVYAYKQDIMLKHDIKSEENASMDEAIKKLKSIVQQYNEAMINNDLVIK